MTSTVTLGEVEELAAALPLPDQQRLVEWMSERLATRENTLASARAFLKICLENPVRPASEMDSGAEIAVMREERGKELS